MQRLDGQVAIVTGAARGIGLGISRPCSRAEGADVVIADLDGDAGRCRRAELDPSGEHALAVTTDVTVRADLEALATAAVDRWGRIDILAANAGIYPHVPLAELTPDDLDRLIAINVRGARVRGAGLPAADAAQDTAASC